MKNKNIFQIYCLECYKNLNINIKTINIYTHAPCMKGVCMGCQTKIKGNNLIMFKYK